MTLKKDAITTSTTATAALTRAPLPRQAREVGVEISEGGSRMKWRMTSQRRRRARRRTEDDVLEANGG